MERRGFLKVAGSAGLVVAAAAVGAGAFALTRTPTHALEPWQKAGEGYADPLRWALSYAILAPNPHNTQPWLIELKSETEGILYCDLDRLLPETDPFGRQILMGLGCFLEQFAIAAEAKGYDTATELFPEGEPGTHLDVRPIARLKLTERAGSPSVGDLFAHMLERRTNRNPYDMDRPVEQARLTALQGESVPTATIVATNAEADLSALRELTRKAVRTEFTTPAVHAETVGYMRIGKAEIEARPYGLALQGVALDTMRLLGILNKKSMADPNSMAFKSGLKMADDQSNSAMAFLWINTPGNGRVEQIEAGRAYLRVTLRAQSLGLAIQPLSQALQEYEAQTPYYNEVHERLAGVSGERVQMLARLGYAKPVPHAPRSPLEDRIRQS